MRVPGRKPSSIRRRASSPGSSIRSRMAISPHRRSRRLLLPLSCIFDPVCARPGRLVKTTRVLKPGGSAAHSGLRVLQNKGYQMTSDFLVQILRPADLDRILELEYACFRKDAYDRKLFAEYARTCGEYFLVARRRGAPAICGYMLTCPGRPEAEVVSIAIDPAVRRK